MKRQKGISGIDIVIILLVIAALVLGFVVMIQKQNERKNITASMETDRCTLQSKVQAELPLDCSGKGCPSDKPLIKTYKCEAGKPTRFLVTVGEN